MDEISQLKEEIKQLKFEVLKLNQWQIDVMRELGACCYAINQSPQSLVFLNMNDELRNILSEKGKQVLDRTVELIHG